MKVDKTFKGQLTSDEMKSGTITVAFKQVDDPRYKGDKVPALKEGERYVLFIVNFDTAGEQRVALLHTKNNIRESAEVAADATAKKALQSTVPK